MTCDEVKQLRLGNIVVRRSNPNEYLVVDIELFIKISRMPQMFRFVELTEYWLIKAGFENINMGFSADYSKDNIELNLVNGLYEYGDYCKLQYVHRLQNLYFELRDEELKQIEA